jgi:hypothetical protein
MHSSNFKFSSLSWSKKIFRPYYLIEKIHNHKILCELFLTFLYLKIVVKWSRKFFHLGESLTYYKSIWLGWVGPSKKSMDLKIIKAAELNIYPLKDAFPRTYTLQREIFYWVGRKMTSASSASIWHCRCQASTNGFGLVSHVAWKNPYWKS